ncbi:hypothetical protein JTE90_027942 [Oedothorax gibbosus]|uniref:Zinc finger PHD-type domain-containing protein n=1 Tax=Oedothorax gibbosus TaxID=931172 RepID=A0AAV6VHP3_9ARAC|nr:hypothetical protein JTE90_027942 [Oedothorax gibbosus]
MRLKSKTKASPKPKKTISKTTVSAKSKSRRNIIFDDSSSEEKLLDTKDIVQDDYLDDVDPMKSFLDKGLITREASGSKDVCILCGDFGKAKELWYRCCLCSGWIHSACGAAEAADNYICDLCTTLNV